MHDLGEESLEEALNRLEGGGGRATAHAKHQRQAAAARASQPSRGQAAAEAAADAAAAAAAAEAAGVAAAEEPIVAEDEKEVARNIIRDALKKLGADGKGDAQGNVLGKTTLEKLRTLLGDEPVSGEHEDPPPPEHLDEEEASHVDFAKRLKEEGERKLDFDLKAVKREFKRDYGPHARLLLCSGCKLVAARLTSELDTHDVHDQDSPAQMLTAKRRAIDATCSSLRHLTAVIPDAGESGRAHFEASDSGPDDDAGQRSGQRLCAGILEESRFDMLARLIQRKVPEMSHFHGHVIHNNWERWLCAERTRLCKRSEVRDDDEDEALEQEEL